MTPEPAGAAPPSSRPPSATRSAGFEVVQMAGGIVLFLVLLYEMHVPASPGRFLTPPLIAVAAAILLWPMRRQRAVRALLLSGSFLMLVWVLRRLSIVLLPFAGVYVVAFLFDPLVERLRERWRVPRWASSLGVTALVVGVFTAIILILVPSLVSQLEELAARLLASITFIQEWLVTSPVLDHLERAGVVRKQDLIAQTTVALQEQAMSIAGSIPNAVQRLMGYIGSLLGLVTTLTIIPVILYYTLKDYPYIRRRLVDLFPTFGGRRDYLMKAGGVVGSYLRGQLTISAIAALNVSVLLMLFHVPFALLIGMLAGLLNMIPNLGALITNVIGILVAVVFGDPWFIDALVVFLVLLGQSILEQTVLQPKILSSQVGLHPVLIVLSLFVFGAFMGIFGLLIAVPTTALLMTFYKAYRHHLTLELSAGHALPPAD